MKVKELIEELNKFNPDANLAFDNFEDDVTAKFGWSNVNGGDSGEAERDTDREKAESTHISLELLVNGKERIPARNEQERKQYTYDWPRPMATADGLIWKMDSDHKFQILLVKRRNEPFKGKWALPGGYIEMDETVKAGALREIKEETGLDSGNMDIDSLKFGRYYDLPERDPRGRTISFVFTTFCYKPENAKAGDDASEIRWFNLDNLPDLAFDHYKIINDCFRNGF